jgi:hypothetical protein
LNKGGWKWHQVENDKESFGVNGKDEKNALSCAQKKPLQLARNKKSTAFICRAFFIILLLGL